MEPWSVISEIEGKQVNNKDDFSIFFNRVAVAPLTVLSETIRKSSLHSYCKELSIPADDREMA